MMTRAASFSRRAVDTAFACLAAAISRDEWTLDECLTVDQALHCYCLGGPYAAHAEVRLGSLAPGKLADFVILSADPTTLDAPSIAALKAEHVFVGGAKCDR
jgi:predicted amidohydrolase YtcJ